MTRFDPARRGRIMAWTGAALAWGTAVTVAGIEPSPAAPATSTPDTELQPPVTVQVTSAQSVIMPQAPSEGLVILRYQPSAEAAPEVQTVYVREKAPATKAAPSQPAPAPAPAPAPPPAPKSSGS